MHRLNSKYTTLFLLFSFLVLIISPISYAQPNVSAAAAILMDAETGEILWSQNEHEKRAPASITKLVTALVAIEKGNLKDEVTISQEAVNTKGSIVWLRAGETQTLEDLLYAIMLNSGNDAARAIAEHVGGTIDEFVAMMNEKVRVIGTTSTQFQNPDGLPDADHYSTAYDIALITREAIANPLLREIMGTKTRQWSGMDWQSQLVNLNQLLWEYEGSIGGKTGFTSEAGRCLTVAAKKNGLELISVVLGSPNAQRLWADSTRILDYGFNNFHKIKIVTAGQEMLQVQMAGQTVPILVKEDVDYLTSKSSEEMPSWKIKLNQLELPLQRGDEVGTLKILLNDKDFKDISLVAGSSIKKPVTWIDIYVKITLTFFGLLVLAVLLKIINSVRRRRSMYAGKVARPRYSSSSNRW
ncbi:MAG: D-alanyl-D-alanine carboxypeptidase family protein [Bacillota bacterium]